MAYRHDIGTSDRRNHRARKYRTASRRPFLGFLPVEAVVGSTRRAPEHEFDVETVASAFITYHGASLFLLDAYTQFKANAEYSPGSHASNFGFHVSNGI